MGSGMNEKDLEAVRRLIDNIELNTEFVSMILEKGTDRKSIDEAGAGADQLAESAGALAALIPAV